MSQRPRLLCPPALPSPPQPASQIGGTKTRGEETKRGIENVQTEKGEKGHNIGPLGNKGEKGNTGKHRKWISDGMAVTMTHMTIAGEVIKADPKCHSTPVCCCYTPKYQTTVISSSFTSLANTGTLSASWMALPPCQAALLSLHVAFSFSPPLSATHLGLVIHDSWSRVSKFNLRCDKTAHIYKLCAESLPMWIIFNLFLLSNMCRISNA